MNMGVQSSAGVRDVPAKKINAKAGAFLQCRSKIETNDTNKAHNTSSKNHPIFPIQPPGNTARPRPRRCHNESPLYPDRLRSSSRRARCLSPRPSEEDIRCNSSTPTSPSTDEKTLPRPTVSEQWPTDSVAEGGKSESSRSPRPWMPKPMARERSLLGVSWHMGR
ncbi:uncharacterized protein K452DRAFT_341867 [Aplosporella prunicola CBS 121167]|uniref:Uncharacterized protein n=1 Tax=Aplosporella prunicola CBS 121167 TaxID=1176127 RepID=A0A6A6AYV6_9PEZI|nr:uncharacterized protein K452DRAFT_341867 [Aplosporella prunicola CBS 121167]KAF2136960.1 hypothetical protein K452DRAFT_341867 [Aplosporella prunicola CBS 121167]